jgi:hypothetical protein
MNKQPVNYNGDSVTYDRLFEVINDYLDGVRAYSITPDGVCRFRQGQNSCLVGSFLSNYTPDMEGCSLGDERIKAALDLKVSRGSLKLFLELHDRLANINRLGLSITEEQKKVEHSEILQIAEKICSTVSYGHKREADKLKTKITLLLAT